MMISVRAKPGARETRVVELDREERSYEVWVPEPPVQGRANRAIAVALATHFGVAKGKVRLVSGFTSRQKIFEID